MPHVSDKVLTQPGSWTNPRTKRPRFSTSTCPVCGFWLHQILAAAGLRFHYLCDPRPAHLRSVR